MRKKDENQMIKLSLTASFLLAFLAIFIIGGVWAREEANSQSVNAIENNNAQVDLREVLDKSNNNKSEDKDKDKDKDKGEDKLKQPEELKPSFSFDMDRNVSGEVEIKGEVEAAKKVEFFLIRTGSVEPKIYLGKAEEDEGEWELEYDFSNVPGGNYDLYANTKNAYGSYQSMPVKIMVSGFSQAEENNKEEGEREDEKIERDNSSDIGNEISEQAKENNINREKDVIEKENERKEAKDEIKDKDKKEKDLSKDEDERNNVNIVEKNKKDKINNFKKEAENLLNKKKRGLTKEEKDKLEKIKEQLRIDSDGDGLPDHEEERMGTDPFSADSDGDGYLDGDEVEGGYDPLEPSSGNKEDKIVFEEPETKGEVNHLYTVEKVESFREEEEKGKVKEGVSIKGKALPNSFLTLYIYSDPVVVTVKTDDDGNWSYVLDKELEDGEHKVYAAVTDNTGKITAKSEPFAFVKSAQAITPKAEAADLSGYEDAAKSPVDKNRDKLAAFVILISVSALFLALFSVVLLFRQHKKDNEEN